MKNIDCLWEKEFLQINESIMYSNYPNLPPFFDVTVEAREVASSLGYLFHRFVSSNRMKVDVRSNQPLVCRKLL